jgi:hypothetical protein
MIILEVLAWAALIVLVIIGFLAIGVYNLVKDIADSVDYIRNHVVFIANLVPNLSKLDDRDLIKTEIEIIEEDISNLYLRIRDLEEKKND